MREYLILLRKERGLSQEDVAKQLLISQNYLSLIESGNRQTDLKLSTLKGFAKIYQVDIGRLIVLESDYQKNMLNRMEVQYE